SLDLDLGAAAAARGRGFEGAAGRVGRAGVGQGDAVAHGRHRHLVQVEVVDLEGELGHGCSSYFSCTQQQHEDELIQEMQAVADAPVSGRATPSRTAVTDSSSRASSSRSKASAFKGVLLYGLRSGRSEGTSLPSQSWARRLKPRMPASAATAPAATRTSRQSQSGMCGTWGTITARIPSLT